MPFECRVRPDRELLDALLKGQAEFACYVPRVEQGDVFSTTGDEEFLDQVQTLALAVGGGDRLLHASKNEPMIWVPRGDRRPHVRAHAGATSTEAWGDTNTHHWLRGKLFRLGQILGQDPAIEFDVGGSGERICDVAWRRSSIAWEIDLTPQSQNEQKMRAQICAENNFDMVSIIDGADHNRANEKLPRVRVRNLKALAQREGEHQWGLLRAFVLNQRECIDRDVGPKWHEKRNVEFEQFCRALIAKKLDYTLLDVWAWVGKSELVKFEDLEAQAAIEAAQEVEEQRRGRRVQDEAQAEEQAQIASRSRQQAMESDAQLRAQVFALKPIYAGSRERFLEYVETTYHSRQREVGDAISDLAAELRSYERAPWLWILCITYWCDKARERALALLDSNLRTLEHN